MRNKQVLEQIKTKEMYDMVESKANTLGMKWVTIVSFCLWIFNSIQGKDSESILLILLTGIIIRYWVKYRNLREKSDFILLVGGFIGWIGVFIKYVSRII